MVLTLIIDNGTRVIRMNWSELLIEKGKTTGWIHARVEWLTNII